MTIQSKVAALCGALALIAAPLAHAQATKAKALPAQATYASPEAAAKALYDAVKSDNLKAIYTVLGPGSQPVIFSGDRVADDAVRNDLIASWDRSLKVDKQGDAKATLLVGPNDTPFPFPLVKEGNAWKFDAKAGAEEVVNRRIGENELAAMKVCLAFVDAQREYAEVDRDAAVSDDEDHLQPRRALDDGGRPTGLDWITPERTSRLPRIE